MKMTKTCVVYYRGTGDNGCKIKGHLPSIKKLLQ
jgi:hypothetical protein